MTKWSHPRYATIALALFATAGCARQRSTTLGGKPLQATRQATAATEIGPSSRLVGWITFNSELQIYARREDIGRKYDRLCISGRFATLRQQRSAASRFQGKKVVITGTLLNADQYMTAHEFDPLVENYCASDQILIARTIEISPRQL